MSVTRYVSQLVRLCESPSIDKDAMALKVYQNISILLFILIKYTCPREKNSKINRIIQIQKHFQRHLQKIYFQYLNETPYDLVAAQ